MKTLLFLTLVCFFCPVFVFSAPGDTEYTGQFEQALGYNSEDTERVIFKPLSAEKLKGSTAFSKSAKITYNRLYNPATGKNSILALLVEDEDEPPVMFVDINGDNSFNDQEKKVLQKESPDNPYRWKTVLTVPMKDDRFESFQIFVRYLWNTRSSKMMEGDRLVMQTAQTYARGNVDVKGKKVLVQYAYDFQTKKITPNEGWLGVDTDQNGEIDMDDLSPEAAKASDETVIFRIGDTYLSTKKVDPNKNLIVMREHKASEYKRFEFALDKEMPDFSFVDFSGKKRKLSEFRGKYVLLDFWGFWCPPCRDEIPHLREAYEKFQSRNLVLVGMNTDVQEPGAVKEVMKDVGIIWTQGQLKSIFDLVNQEFRIESFPTTILISPEGRILSMSRDERNELDLRGPDLIKSLDKILPD